MISADSILSMFTDRFTLLKYLQVLDADVQKLLEKAVTSVSVDRVPDTTDEYTLTINFEDGTSETTPAFTIEQGEDGEDGRGIVSITKTDTTGNVDTYTITYTDSTTSTFTVTNGVTPIMYKHTVTATYSDGSFILTVLSLDQSEINTFEKLYNNKNKILNNIIYINTDISERKFVEYNDIEYDSAYEVCRIKYYDATTLSYELVGSITDSVVTL